MRKAIGPLVGLAIALASPASAHEGGRHALGTVKEISANRIVVTTADGHDVAFTIGADTRFRRGDAPVARGEVHAGERAVVHGRTAGDHTEASEIRLGKPKS